MVGELNEALTPQDFLALLKKNMELNVIKHTAFTSAKVKTIAVCGGAGSFLLPDAIRSRADVFVTSDYKYHQFFDADNKIVIADVGHYESEIFTTRLLAEQILEKIPTFVPIFSETVTNPVNYYY
jgi:putative NIF3 family GTP cyclohydrolase 1 type 2